MRTIFPSCSIFVTLVIQLEDGLLSQSPVTKQSHPLKGQIDFRLPLTNVGRIMRSLSFFLLWPTSWSRVTFYWLEVGGSYSVPERARRVLQVRLTARCEPINLASKRRARSPTRSHLLLVVEEGSWHCLLITSYILLSLCSSLLTWQSNRLHYNKRW